ncbi:MAG: hypothetical protein ACRD0O_06770 [Acidimicrobiia bacterium]
METFLGALGIVVTLFVALITLFMALRAEFRSEVRDVRGELRTEIRDLRVELGGKMDRLSEQLLQHVQQGHPPHQAA